MQNNKTFYVENDEKMVYKVTNLELRADGWLNISLEFVCGFDYIKADENNEQGYIGKENFVNVTEHDLIACDVMNESIVQALEYHNYKVVENLPKIY